MALKKRGNPKKEVPGAKPLERVPLDKLPFEFDRRVNVVAASFASCRKTREAQAAYAHFVRLSGQVRRREISAATLREELQKLLIIKVRGQDIFESVRNL